MREPTTYVAGMKWWPHLLWVNICSIRLLKFNWTKTNDFWSSCEGKGCIMLIWAFVLSVSFKRPSFIQMKWSFWRINWRNFQIEIKANEKFFSWIELTKNKKSLVSIAFNWDLLFISFGLFHQLDKLPFQKFLFQLKEIHMAYLCLLLFLSFRQIIRIEQNEANSVCPLLSCVATVWPQSGRQIDWNKLQDCFLHLVCSVEPSIG